LRDKKSANGDLVYPSFVNLYRELGSRPHIIQFENADVRADIPKSFLLALITNRVFERKLADGMEYIELDFAELNFPTLAHFRRIYYFYYDQLCE
jgi:hypothetical protein